MKKHVLKPLAIVGLIFSLASMAGCVAKTRTSKLTNRAPTPAAPTRSATREAIVGACQAQDWAILREKPGELRITRLIRRKHEIELLIIYDDEWIRLQYVSSRSLKYRKEWNGDEYIHNNYYMLVDPLAFEIKKAVSDALLAASSKSP